MLNNPNKILISCVGKRDPWDKGNSKYYGPLLSSILVVKPQKVYLLLNDGNLGEYALTKEFLISNNILSEQNIIELNTRIDKPNDDNEVDIKFRKALYPHLNEFQNVVSKIYVNLSPGTPQMASCLKYLVATKFICENIILVNIKDPKYNKNNNAKIVDDPVSLYDKPDENLSELTSRVIEDTHKPNLPIIDRIKRINAIELIKTYNYHQAKILIENLNHKSKIDTMLLMPLLDICHEITSFNFSIKILIRLKELKNIPKIQDSNFINIFDYLISILQNSDKTSLSYWITETKLKAYRYSEFSIYAGLCRENLLESYISKDKFFKHYSQAIEKKSNGNYFNASKLKSCNKKLYDFLNQKFKAMRTSKPISNDEFDEFSSSEIAGTEFSLKTDFVQNGFFSPKLMLIILEYFAQNEPAEYNDQFCFFNETEKLAGFRNRSAHNFSYLSSNEVEEIALIFKSKLKNIIFANKQEENIFDTINHLLEETLIHWTFN